MNIFYTTVLIITVINIWVGVDYLRQIKDSIKEIQRSIKVTGKFK
jgi:hypothetical protein